MPEAGRSLRGPDSAADQAAGLRRLFAPRGARLLTVLLPDPRVTRRGLALAQFAHALAATGERTLVLDAARQNVAHELGLRARYDLYHGLSGERPLAEVLLPAGPRLRVAPALRAVEQAQARRMALREAIAHAAAGADLVLLIIEAARAAELGESTLMLAGPGMLEIAAAAVALRARRCDLGLVFADATPETVAGLQERLADVAGPAYRAPQCLGGIADPDDAARLAAQVAGWELDLIGATAPRLETKELRA